MSMGNNFQRTNIKSIPPERGAFPLDIAALCKLPMESYMECMKAQPRGEHGACRDLSKAYLECRMNTGLMVKDDLNNIGFTSVANLEKEDPINNHKLENKE
ncbi:cytochrome c oxidase assembly protein COX19 [Chytriomyces sp. MP71]|nr:cytochrome c oxidase assembly protein COX19 [Chytriomyces sp. MP71]